jgi:hypothetical protein
MQLSVHLPTPGFKKEKIRVKPSYLEKKGAVRQWGQGVGQNLDRQRSASSSSTETPSRQGQQGCWSIREHICVVMLLSILL